MCVWHSILHRQSRDIVTSIHIQTMSTMEERHIRALTQMFDAWQITGIGNFITRQIFEYLAVVENDDETNQRSSMIVQVYSHSNFSCFFLFFLNTCIIPIAIQQDSKNGSLKMVRFHGTLYCTRVALINEPINLCEFGNEIDKKWLESFEVKRNK